MTDIQWLIYLYSIWGKILGLMGVLTVIAIFIAVFSGVMYFVEYTSYESIRNNKLMNISKKALITSSVCLGLFGVLGTLLPSKESLALILAAPTIEKFAIDSNLTQTPNKLIETINNSLDYVNKQIKLKD